MGGGSPEFNDSTTLTAPEMAPARRPARTSIASRVHSPARNPIPLGSNDDDLERAQARAARAASVRRKSAAAFPTSAPSQPDLLDREQIMDLLHNCIKLASENKITQKNTWDLKLIDHLSEVIQVNSDEDDAEPNFQKASCTLEAGVKIYSMRVDSLHSEAYKVLGGINRVGQEDGSGNSAEENQRQDQSDKIEGGNKKEHDRKLSPLSTLEASFEALNVKKFDVAFTVDPLYHQTSAQFDEGGVKGLLLNNLGVYGCCRVLFDSSEVPEKCILNEAQNNKSELIDLSFAKEYIEEMLINMPKKSHISPTLGEILNRFDEGKLKAQNVCFVEQQQFFHDGIDDLEHSELGSNSFDDFGCHTFDDEDHVSVVDDSSISAGPDFQEEVGEYSFQDDTDNRLEEIADFLSLGLGFTSKSNAWAGPDHWKYRKIKGADPIPDLVDKSELPTRKAKVRTAASDIDFTKSLEEQFPDIFVYPKNPKSLLLPATRAPCSITLPEDCHYRPESLVKLFLLPDVMCLGKKTRITSDESSEQHDGFVPYGSWDSESISEGHCDDGSFDNDVEDLGALVQPSRQVNKVDIQYDKVSKQVDVHALKETLWMHIAGTAQMSNFEQGSEASVSLTQVMHHLRLTVPLESEKDISPHLFFICLLHLANEHGLTLHHPPTLDNVDIHIPAALYS